MILHGMHNLLKNLSHVHMCASGGVKAHNFSYISIVLAMCKSTMGTYNSCSL